MTQMMGEHLTVQDIMDVFDDSDNDDDQYKQ